MPKIIIPKRTDKALSVEEYWNIRNQYAKPTTHILPAYRQDQVTNRYRFQRISQQAYFFNPLLYFLTKKIDPELQKTHTQTYMEQIRYRLPQQIMRIKSLMLGLASVLQNMSRILQILWSHLNCDDSWKILQTILKDTKSESYTLWMEKGLQILTHQIDTNFQATKFRNIFDTFCVFMENCYPKIAENADSLLNFFGRVREIFIVHPNKYFRKYVLMSLSYVLSNVDEQLFQEFITKMLTSEQHQQLVKYVSDFLSMRLKYSSGCLTPHSLQQFVHIINWLDQLTQQQLISHSTITEFLQKVIKNLKDLSDKKNQQTLNLFDLSYVIKAMIQISNDNKLPPVSVIMSLDYYMYDHEEVTSKNKKMMKKYKVSLSNDLRKVAFRYLWENLGRLGEGVNVYRMLADSFTEQLSSLDTIQTYLANQPQDQNILFFLQLLENKQISSDSTKILITSLSNRIKKFIDTSIQHLNSQLTQIVYRCVLLAKTKNFTIKSQIFFNQNIEQTLNSNLKQLSNCYKSIQSPNSDRYFQMYSYTIAYLRFLSILQFPQKSIKSIEKSLQLVYNVMIQPYTKQINQKLGNTESNSLSDIYNISHYTEQILTYQHQSVPLMIRCSSLLEAFLQLQEKKQILIIQKIPHIFQKVFIHKFSLLNIHTHKLFQDNICNIYNMLQARNREVRLYVLSWLKGQNSKKYGFHQKYKIIVQYLYEIDSEVVDLETQREVKRLLLELRREIVKLLPNETQIKTILFCWSLGFAYTGFKLIQSNFIDFFKQLLQISTECSEIKHKLLQYIALEMLRNSRIYQNQIHKIFPIASEDQQSYNSSSVFGILKKDFAIYSNEVEESIGINRIAKAVGYSEKVRIAFSHQFTHLLDQYFSEDFNRQKNTIKKLAYNQLQYPQNQLSLMLMPPKSSFLESVILKLPPPTYLPPYQCLHHTKQPYLSLPAISKLKRQNWQLNWTKANNNKTKKNNEKQILNVTINFEKMGIQEKLMYLHFLFGELLKCNAAKLRSTLEYIRDYLGDVVPYFFEVLINQCFLAGVFKLYDVSEPDKLVDNGQLVQNIFRYIDSRKLLTYMYILKASIKCLAYYIRQGISEHLFYLLIQLLDTVNNKQKQQNQMVDQNQQNQQNEQNVAEDKQQQNEQNSEQQQNQQQNKHPGSGDKQYKNHRKQLYKILTLIFHQLSQAIPQSRLRQILQIFSQQNKIIAIPTASIHSVPGILNFIKEVSTDWRYSSILLDYGIIPSISELYGRCLETGADSTGRASVGVATDILVNILGIRDQMHMADEQEQATIAHNIKIMKNYHQTLLQNILNYLCSLSLASTSKQPLNPKTINSLTTKILKICSLLSSPQTSTPIHLQKRWEPYLLKQLQKIIKKNKSLNQKNQQRLQCILKLMMNYIYYQQQDKEDNKQEPLLIKLVYYLPHIKDIAHRRIIIESVRKYCVLGCSNITLSKQAAEISLMITSIVPNSLQKQLDFVSFFKGVEQYKQFLQNFTIRDHEYILYCLLSYICHEEFSIRKSINTLIEQFLSTITIQHKKLVGRLFRNILEYLKKPVAAQEHLFWSVLSIAAHFVRWIQSNDRECSREGYALFGKYLGKEANYENDVFQLLCGLSQNKKMEGLKKIQKMLAETDHSFDSKLGFTYPNIISAIILPILEHMIFPPAPSQYSTQSNLSSTLSHISLQVYEVAMSRAGQSLQKKQLKRLITKLKLDTNTVGVSTSTIIKRNILVIKIIGKIIEAINLPNSTHSIKQMIKESGFDELHRKIVEKESRFSNIREEDEDDDEDEEEARKKKAFNGINHDINDQEVINMNYLAFDKKLMQMQEEEEQEQEDDQQQIQENKAQDKGQQQSSKKNIIRFLKFNILAPLKTLLMFENKSQKNNQEENDKSRMYLSIVVTKIIMKFPLDVFLIELQKVLSKLGRLLKKKKYQVRENSRKCLAEISKLVGPQLLYMIIRELKFHLRDNFQNHVLNYTIYYILQKISSGQSKSPTVNLTHISNGSIDHILPLLLPPIIDQIFGIQSQQKEQVDEHLIPTINIQSKKRKGYQLLGIMCKHISIDKIEYLIKYFQKFLKEYMNTEANLMKYEEMLNSAIFSGLSKNEAIINSNKTIMKAFLTLLHQSIESLKTEIKIYKFSTNQQFSHESTIRQQSKHKAKKTGLKETYQLQEETGRNASIFKKQEKVLKQHRNRQILINSLLQFYLGLLTMLIKKKVINQESLQQSDMTEEFQYFNSIINFVVECLDHRDNRLLNRSLKIVHHVINWKNIGEEIIDVTDTKKSSGNKKLLKKVCRKIFVLIQKLTHTDQQLLKQCFVLLNDVLSQVSITADLLPTIMTIIKLHIQSNQQTIIEQPYKLFRTVLYKVSNSPLIFDPTVRQMYEFVRISMINTSLDNIRATCRHICLIYIKQMDIDHHASKREQHMSIGFKDQVSFYLNNLDCKYSESQLCILDILEEAISHRSKQEIQETGEIIIMSLGTAYANDKQNFSKIKKLITQIALKIDKSKTLKLIEKSLIWANNQTNKLIPICGLFLINSLISIPQLQFKPTKEHSANFLKLGQEILQQQSDKVALYYDNMHAQQEKKQAIKNNPEWADIIKEGEYDDNYLEIDNRIVGCLELLSWCVKNGALGNKNGATQREVVGLLWELLVAPGGELFSNIYPLILEIKSLSTYLGNTLMSEERQQKSSLRNKLLQLAQNIPHTHSQQLSQLLTKILSQLIPTQDTIRYLSSCLSVLLNKINRSILSLKKNQNVMNNAIRFCITLLAYKQDVLEQIMKVEEIQSEVLRTIAKVTRNQLVPTLTKQHTEQLSQLLKQFLGQSEFYRKIAEIESERKQKKTEEKIKLSQLAVTDQQQYYKQKGNKKHKKI